MTQEKPKTKAGKFLQIAGKLLKGQVKSVPFVGNIIVDGIEMITKKDLVTGAPKTHNTLVYIVEITGAVTLAYLVIKGIIPVEQFIQFLQSLIAGG